VIGDTFPPEKSGSALGLIGAVFGLAFIIGPILGGVLLLFGWAWLFIVNLPIALVVIVLSLQILPATRPPQRKPFDWLGMLALALLLSSLAYGINQIDTKNLFVSLVSLNVASFILAASIFLALFVVVERGAADPVLQLNLFKSRQIVLASGLSAGAGLGEAGLVFMPALAVVGLNVKESTASFLLMPVVLAMSVGSPMVGRFLDKFGSKVIVFTGATLLAIGMILLSVFATSLMLFIVTGVVIGLGLSALLGAPIRYILLNEAPVSQRAAA
jgi:MFS family permease